MKKKPIVVSMGEPSGISTEIILKSWKYRNKYKLPIFNIDEKVDFKLGKPNKKNAKIILRSIKISFDFVAQKKALGLLTLPVCKRTLKSSGFTFNGQTEFIGDLSKKKFRHKNKEIMILSTTKPSDKGKNLIVGLVTTHIPLKRIFSFLKKKEIEEKIWKIKQPRIGITGLNPHSGEDGLIGDEEKKVIEPIIKKLKTKGILVSGPLSSDTCFFKNIREKYDGILCLYHDQALSPIKTLDFFNSINVTAGLPIIRVSPDHGPAFDIAKLKLAKINSVISSIKFLERHA